MEIENSREKKIIDLMGIKKKDTLSYEEIDIDLSKPILKKGLLISKDKDILVKDPLNMHIHVVKKDIKFRNIYLIKDNLFENICENIMSETRKTIDITDDIALEEESLDNTEISKLLYQIFYAAKIKGASDIHINPKQDKTNVKFRIDGKMTQYNDYPRTYAKIIVNKVKSQSGIDQFDIHLPQDGKLKTIIDKTSLEYRVSTIPTIFGENIVMRISDSKDLSGTKLEDQGFEKEDLESYRKVFAEPYGLILNVGPTGQGKTTTFYLTLHELFNMFPEKNICTVEDPVETRFEKAIQVQISEEVGRSYPVVLKSLLRQDPDIILIGEMRDKDTASIAVRSSLTGHLVLSTLHATDSLNSITRLKDLEISETLLASTLSCVLSQRLVRKLCTCKEKYTLEKDIVEKYDLDFTEAYKPVGCSKCNAGYRGREAIIEILIIDDIIKTAISNNKSEIDLKEIVREKGFNNLWTNGLKKVRRGVTSFEEFTSMVKFDSIINKRGK